MANQHKKYIILAAGLIISQTAWADELPLMLIGNCTVCHGLTGSSVGPATPTIAGMDSEDFVDAMLEYQNDKRPSTIMGRIAKGYRKADFQMMADYFAQQEIVRYSQSVDAEKVEKGKKLHKKYCERCHENNGYGYTEEGYGILAGQRMPYLRFSLTDYQTGVRDMPRKMEKRMQKMVTKHGEESLEDLIHFYGSQTQ
jgi:sulfide dehydrogenase cytochrome subunit